MLLLHGEPGSRSSAAGPTLALNDVVIGRCYRGKAMHSPAAGPTLVLNDDVVIVGKRCTLPLARLMVVTETPVFGNSEMLNLRITDVTIL